MNYTKLVVLTENDFDENCEKSSCLFINSKKSDTDSTVEYVYSRREMTIKTKMKETKVVVPEEFEFH